MRRKRFLIIVLTLLLVYGIWLTVQSLMFQTHQGVSSSSHPNEIVGAYHMHTTFSDGRKSVDEVARIASHEALDFIILTDHGHPNRESFLSQGWKEGVLVLSGTEISSNRGHLVGLGFEKPDQDFSHTAEEAVYQLLSQGGPLFKDILDLGQNSRIRGNRNHKCRWSFEAKHCFLYSLLANTAVQAHIFLVQDPQKA